MNSELVMYNVQLLIFHVEICAVLVAAVYRWQRTGIKDGALSATMVLLSFLLLWSLTGFICGVAVPDSFPVLRDTLSMVLVLPAQFWFIRLLFPKQDANIAHG